MVQLGQVEALVGVFANREGGAAKADRRSFFEGKAQCVGCQSEVSRAQGHRSVGIATQIEFGAIEKIQVFHSVLLWAAPWARVFHLPGAWRTAQVRSTSDAEVGEVRRFGRRHAPRRIGGRAERSQSEETKQPANRQVGANNGCYVHEVI